jgi:hypothetical protein
MLAHQHALTTPRDAILTHSHTRTLAHAHAHAHTHTHAHAHAHTHAHAQMNSASPAGFSLSLPKYNEYALCIVCVCGWVCAYTYLCGSCDICLSSSCALTHALVNFSRRLFMYMYMCALRIYSYTTLHHTTSHYATYTTPLLRGDVSFYPRTDIPHGPSKRRFPVTIAKFAEHTQGV